MAFNATVFAQLTTSDLIRLSELVCNGSRVPNRDGPIEIVPSGLATTDRKNTRGFTGHFHLENDALLPDARCRPIAFRKRLSTKKE